MTTLFAIIGALVTALWTLLILTALGCWLWHQHELRAARRQRERDMASYEAARRLIRRVIQADPCTRYGHAWTTCEEGDVRICPRCEAVEIVEGRT
jgi:hypothetical protein